MTGHDRKRGYSQAFRLAMNVSSKHQTQVPKTIVALSLSEFSTPSWLEGSNKENATPFDERKGKAPLTPDRPQSKFHYPPGLTPFPLERTTEISFRGRPLQDLIQLPQDAGEAPGQALSPSSGAWHRLTLDSNHSSNVDLPGFEFGSPGPMISVHEDDYAMSDTQVSTGPPTPSALNMQDLSLADHQTCPLPRLPIRRNRATAHIAPLSHWAG
jgi:hypothetical protein